MRACTGCEVALLDDEQGPTCVYCQPDPPAGAQQTPVVPTEEAAAIFDAHVHRLRLEALMASDDLADGLAGLARPAWHADAACRGRTAAFFPGRGEWKLAEAAVAICQGCPVRDDCLDHALAEDERHGIWGGTTERERRGLRRERAA